MSLKSRLSVCAASVGLIIVQFAAYAAEPAQVSLPPPETDGGKPLMKALKERASSRAFSAKKLSEQMLSNLLWAAAGVNRKESGKRTAPTAVNWQEIDIYVALAGGLYLFDAKQHVLVPILASDIRAAAGKQAFFATAPATLIYVADYARMGSASDADKQFYSATDTGFISQNVYLFCASEGLSTVVVGMVDRPALSKTMSLRPGQKIILTQPVGYPQE